MSPPTSGAPPAPDRPEVAPRAGHLSLLAVCVGFFVIQIDATAVNVALPGIARGLDASLTHLQWVVDAYTLALAGFMLTAGSVADRLGARRVFALGMAVFTVGSLACAVAPHQILLVAARVLQGAGAAALLPCSLALIVHQFPDHGARARALGAWGAAGSAGVAAGPVLGGALVASVGWRAIFLINVPIGVVELWLLHRYVDEAPRRRAQRLDGRGLALSIVALGSVTAACIEAGGAGWASPVPVALFAVGLAAGGAFCWAEHRVAEPMLPPQLFRSRPFSAAVIVGACFNFSLYGALLCLSIFLQQTRSESALRTGLLLLPMAVLVAVGSVVSGRLTGRGHRAPMMIGLLIGGAGAAVLTTVTATTALSVIVVGTLALGLCSVAMPAMSSLAVGSAPSERAGLASGVLNTARQSGGALGVAVLGSLLVVSGRGPAHYSLAVPLAVSCLVLVAAAAVSWVGTRGERGPAAGTAPADEGRSVAREGALTQSR